MALNGDNLGAAMYASIQQLHASGLYASQAGLQGYSIEYYKALGNAIIAYMIANTVVTTTSGAPDGEHSGVVS